MVVRLPVKEPVVGQHDDATVAGVAQFADGLDIAAKMLVRSRDLQLPVVAVELVGVNTAHPNLIVAEAIAEGQIPELRGYAGIRREVRYGRNSRVDFLLQAPARPPCYVEVKNVHLMRRPGVAEFPDAVTARGAKHLDELAGMVAAGNRALMVYLVQIPSAISFALARDIDPTYAAAFDRARGAGVEAIAYRCSVAHDAIVVSGPVPIVA